MRVDCSFCLFSCPLRLMVGKAKMGPVGRGVRVGTGVCVVMRGVARKASLVGVEDGILRTNGVRVAVGVRDGLKKKGVREGVVLSSEAAGVLVLVSGGKGVLVRVGCGRGVGVRVGGGGGGVLVPPTTMVVLSLLPSAETLTVYSPLSEKECPIWHFPSASVVQSPIGAPSTKNVTLTPDFGVPFSVTSAVSVTGVLGCTDEGALMETLIPPWAWAEVYSVLVIRIIKANRLTILYLIFSVLRLYPRNVTYCDSFDV